MTDVILETIVPKQYCIQMADAFLQTIVLEIIMLV
jgi:hypothetical protein